MKLLLRSGLAILLFIGTIFGLSALKDHLDPNEHKPEEQREDKAWISTSKYWLDRQACRWIGLCGLAHWAPDPAVRPWNKRRDRENEGRNPQELLMGAESGEGEIPDEEEDVDAQFVWDRIPGQGERLKPGDWDGDPRVLRDVPQYVLDHAPLVHLYSGEQFWPSDIREHLQHLVPYNGYTDLNITGFRPDVDNLLDLNEGRRGRNVFLHSKDDVEDRPEWLSSAYNKPVPYDDDDDDDNDGKGDEEGELEEETVYEESSSGDIPSEEDLETWFDPYGPKHKIAAPLETTFQTQPSHQNPSQSQGTKQTSKQFREELRKRNPTVQRPPGYSSAPAILVLVDKGSGILDAYWFYFYSYNLGTTVLNVRFGNHVGDWEHSLIRFHHGVPKAVFFSAHSGGLAYSYAAVEKGKGKGREGRPVIYSALGSHAMYASPGTHPYVLPFGLLADVCDRGPLWDPAQNYLAYHYNTSITHDADARTMATNLPLAHMKSSLQPAADNPEAPMGWWWFAGHWGDKYYTLGDRRQWRFAGQYHYVNGPLGPRWKNLGRSKVCQSRGECKIVDSLQEGRKRSWVG
ncbi:vacuolar protein sorting-associated protein [Diplocarpon rosae]|nr:vacuolar protein sorting-associated protein [Diplocarpon rosae]